jgi:hypothetical protein
VFATVDAWAREECAQMRRRICGGTLLKMRKSVKRLTLERSLDEIRPDLTLCGRPSNIKEYTAVGPKYEREFSEMTERAAMVMLAVRVLLTNMS